MIFMYKIMIVDDDPTSLAIGKAHIQNDYFPILMKSGVQALGYMVHNPLPDIILLDMLMPGTSGMDVLRVLKGTEAYSHIPVLFLTSMDDMNLETQGYTLGAVDFIHKPIIPVLLLKKLERQIYILELERENAKLREKIAELESHA